MRSLKISNEIGSFTLAQAKPYLLQTLDGIGGAEADIIVETSPFQEGATDINAFYRPRNITGTGMIIASSLSDLNTYKRLISSICNPKLLSTITYTNGTVTKEITGRAEYSPKWGTDKSERRQDFFFSFLCADPMWRDIDNTQVVLAIEEPMFIFPLLSDPTFMFGDTGTNRATLTNVGDIATPMNITFIGPATNPKLLNETTGDFVQVTVTLLSGEKLIIDTTPKAESVTFVDTFGEETDKISYIDLSSNFPLLEVGENEISFECDSGIDTATVSILYKNRYNGI